MMGPHTDGPPGTKTWRTKAKKAKAARPAQPTDPRESWTFEDHLANCKLKALVYVDGGHWHEAVAAFCSALIEDESTRSIATLVVAMSKAQPITDAESATTFILGFYA